MVLVKTKDIRAVLYSIVKQLKNNDEFKYTVFNSWTSITKLNEAIGKNEITAIRIISNIRKVVTSGRNVTLFINKVKICDISKIDNNEYAIRDYCGKLLEYIFFYLIGESHFIRIEYKKEGDIEQQVKMYSLDATYSRDCIISSENVYETFSHISTEIADKFKASITPGEEYDVIITSKFVRSDLDCNKQCQIIFEFNITM